MIEYLTGLSLDVDALQLLPGAEAKLSPGGDNNICPLTCCVTCTESDWNADIS